MTHARRTRFMLGAAVVVLALLGLPAIAAAARIKGKIAGWRALENPVWGEAKNPKKYGYSFREPVPTVRAEFRRLFPHIPKEVCIAALAKDKQPPPKTAILIRVGGGRTTPVTIVVPPGTTLQFKNTDPFKHRLYAKGVPTFPPGETGAGAHRDWTVSAAGVYEIRDELAPSLRMFVIAEPNVAGIAYPSMKGEFALTVPADGAYTLQAFFAGKKVGPALPVEAAAGRDFELKEPIKVADEKQAKKPDEDKDKDKDQDKDKDKDKGKGE
jgi:plastocyanin